MLYSINNFLNKLLTFTLLNTIIIVLTITTNPIKEVSSTNNIFLILVNKENPLSKNYQPIDLVELNEQDNIDYIKRENEKMYINKEALFHYKLLYEEALSKGFELTIFSGYRSYEKQEILFNKNKDLRYLAPPGCSEHQTGLALDISTRNIGLTTNFTYTKEYQFLVNNAYKYGFIIRYPETKENITGYYFEPWHFRYIGVEHSTKIQKKNLTLEEYLS